jgi:hypothetical protein
LRTNIGIRKQGGGKLIEATAVGHDGINVTDHGDFATGESLMLKQAD